MGGVQFLPGEIDFLSKKFRIKKDKLANFHKIDGCSVWIITADEKNCPFYKFGRCIKRDARSLDCRSYPAIPYVKNGKLSIILDKKCPLVKKNSIKKGFLDKAKRAWKMVKPPTWWLKIYEKEMIDE